MYTLIRTDRRSSPRALARASAACRCSRILSCSPSGPSELRRSEAEIDGLLARLATRQANALKAASACSKLRHRFSRAPSGHAALAPGLPLVGQQPLSHTSASGCVMGEALDLLGQPITI